MKIGDRVICIVDKWSIIPEKAALNPILPVKGCIYTIRGMINYDWVGPYIGLVFEEFINPTMMERGVLLEISFCSTGFRPVKDTNIDVFESLLNPTPTPERKVLERAI